MSEKLCLQWNDFKENAINAFGSLKEDKDFTDVTLACEDGRQVEAHKVILASSSPFFQNLLRRNKHTHPLIYMRGVKSDDLLAIVDFLYCGEASVHQENLESFLAIAEELQLKGLMGKSDGNEEEKEIYKTPNVLEKEKEKPTYKREARSARHPPQGSVGGEILRYHPDVFSGTVAYAVALNSPLSGELQELLQESDPMLEKTGRKMPNGKPLYNCKVCGKEGEKGNVRQHIETKHIDGISVPCKTCEKTFRSRHLLNQHNHNNHGNH